MGIEAALFNNIHCHDGLDLHVHGTYKPHPGYLGRAAGNKDTLLYAMVSHAHYSRETESNVEYIVPVMPTALMIRADVERGDHRFPSQG